MFRNIVRSVLLAIAVVGVSAPVVIAQAAELNDAQAKKLFNDKGCNACHGWDEPRIGPAYQIIAARYAAQPDAVEHLSRKILYGGAGAWGTVPMIKNPGVSQEEAETIVRWILRLHKTEPPAH